jgi:hypothetical protein
MTIKRRAVEIAVGSGGTASATLGLGAVYGVVRAFELKGDDANVTSSTTFAVVDATGKGVLNAFSPDTGTDDSTNKETNQDYSTVGVYRSLIPLEANVLQNTGATGTDNVGSSGPGVFAKSPLTISVSSGVSGDNHQVVAWVEV